MSETNYSIQPQASTSALYTEKFNGGRRRVISSCLTCRRRKVKCDHAHPVCSSCSRGDHICIWSEQTHAAPHSGRVFKQIYSHSRKAANDSDVQARLERLELLLENALAAQSDKTASLTRSSPDYEILESESQLAQSSPGQKGHGGSVAFDNDDSALILNGEQSQFISSHHYALLAEEIQDMKALVGDETNKQRKLISQGPPLNLLSFSSAYTQSSLQQLLPGTQSHRDKLFHMYLTNVEPLVRIMHGPTIVRKFLSYNREVHPVSFAIYFSAINSLSPQAVLEEFGESKEILLDRFQFGVEMSLAREEYLTTSSLEIFQGFLLWLTCITREEDIGKAWVLLGIAIRIAVNLGLHRDPSLFPMGSMDAITVELRRRAWHHLGHVEFRAAECKGQEPCITEDSYTTLFPRNIDDEDLTGGVGSEEVPYNREKFTAMTFQLVRCRGIQVLRRIVQSTYGLERRILESGLQGTPRPDPALELQNLYEQIKLMLREFHEEILRKYLIYLDPAIPMQRLTQRLADLTEWHCYLLFWVRMPRAYRDTIFSEDIRRFIFEKSVSCVEALNSAAIDEDIAHFKWYIGGIASFQSIMHILSELQSRLIDESGRQRALSALKTTRNIRENNTTKPWRAVKAMIDKAVAEHISCPTTGQYQDPTTFARTISEMSSSPPLEHTQNHNVPFSLSSESTQTYPSQPLPFGFVDQTSIPSHSEQPLQIPMTSQPLVQEPIVPSLNDMRLSDMTDTAQYIQRTSEFNPSVDFGFWGDPMYYESEIAMPSAENYPPPRRE